MKLYSAAIIIPMPPLQTVKAGKDFQDPNSTCSIWGILSLLTQIVAYPSFTESGRWRSDFSLDAKYDLPLDFYVKLGYTLNFDNRPAEGSVKTDYVFHTGFGWEW